MSISIKERVKANDSDFAKAEAFANGDLVAVNSKGEEVRLRLAKGLALRSDQSSNTKAWLDHAKANPDHEYTLKVKVNFNVDGSADLEDLTF